MNYENLTPIVGVITNISTQEGDCCTQVITLGVEGQPVNMILSNETFVVDTMRLMPGCVWLHFMTAPCLFPLSIRRNTRLN